MHASRAERAKEQTKEGIQDLKEGIRDLKKGLKGLFRPKAQDKSELSPSTPVLACRLPPSSGAAE